MANEPATLLTRSLSWRREITDALVIYSVSILISIALSYSELYARFALGERELEKFSIVVLFLGIASAVFGFRRITDQHNERLRRLAAEQQAASLSLHDPVTLLPNRRCLENQISALIERTDSKLAVLLVGLKQFHTINSVYGLASGDAVVSQMAPRLRLDFERLAFLARVGTDEFALLLSSEHVHRSPDIARSLVEAIRQPVQIGTKEYIAEAQVGIVQLTPRLQAGARSARSRQEPACRMLLFRS